MSDLSHRLTAERDAWLQRLESRVRDLEARNALIQIDRDTDPLPTDDTERRCIAERIFPALVSSWSRRDASGMPDYAFFAKQAVMAADELIKAIDNDQD